MEREIVLRTRTRENIKRIDAYDPERRYTAAVGTQNELINVVHSLLEDLEEFMIKDMEDPLNCEAIRKARALINKINGDTE
jgi:hypothetical protein